MTIPTSSNFPESLDNEQNLFLVHDSLRVRLLDDYTPGDTSVLIEGDLEVINKFPPTGLITLTEQCSEIDKRALTFYYGSRTSASFDDLELLPEFSDVDNTKPKRITNITMNVVDRHHNHLKNALINSETFLGSKYTNDKGTITGRIKFLEGLVIKPKAWFSVNSDIGLAPLTVKFTNGSLRLGGGRVKQTWSFGDGSTAVEIITENKAEYLENNTISKTFVLPGYYDVTLTVENDYGTSELKFEKFISVKNECPELAVINIKHRSSQNYTEGNLPDVFPKIRTVANSFIDLEVPEGKNPETPGYTFAGEMISGDVKADPIVEYTWKIRDDLPHANSNKTRASFELGGYYDIDLRVDTLYGSYRITRYNDSIDVVEKTNLWLFNFQPNSKNSDGSGVVEAYEFGLNSETFKKLGNQTLNVTRSNSFLSNSPLSYGRVNSEGQDVDNDPYYVGTYSRAKKEFERNVEFVKIGSIDSGDRGNSLMFWASGGSVIDDKNVVMKKYNAFNDTYESLTSISNRPWNWCSFSSAEKAYFLFGNDSNIVQGQNSAYGQRLDYDLLTQTSASPVSLESSNFENGAIELLEHPSYFNEDGVATNGYFATYRTAWKNQSGYILRNSSVNEFFRLNDFYRTNGSLSSPFNSLTKLPDVIGSIKTEGELVTLSNGIFLFNNSGEICAWNDTTLTWEVGRTNATSLSFRSMQDTSTSGFDDKSKTLLAASDGDRAAYLSYDYSNKAFIKFNATDLTFSTTKFRPSGAQFKMGVY